MAKTITLRIDDTVYRQIKSAADSEKRSISNFIEFATLSFLDTENFVSNSEMNEILQDKTLLKNLKEALADVKKGHYKVVD